VLVVRVDSNWTCADDIVNHVILGILLAYGRNL